MNDVIIREANDGDIPEIANVHINSWREAYRGLLPQDYLDRLPLTFKKRMIAWHDIIREENKWGVYVAEHKSSGIIGFSCTINEVNQAIEGAELSSIYLLQLFKGQGIGFELLKSAFVGLSKYHFNKAHCWVLDGNPTIQFYERTGAVFNGVTKAAMIGGQEVLEKAYIWNDLKAVLLI